MQLRKLATAMLVMGMTAGHSHYQHSWPWRFPQGWHRQMTPPRQQAARWTKSPKTA